MASPISGFGEKEKERRKRRGPTRRSDSAAGQRSGLLLRCSHARAPFRCKNFAFKNLVFDR